MHHLIEQLVLFPSAPHDDLFDAFDLAVTAAERRARKSRSSEPGVI
jgi:ribosome-associated translation inhibitor RaiA